MIVSELIRSIADRLPHHNQVERQQEAWWILQAITDKSEAELLAQSTIELTDEQQKTLDTWLTKHVEQAMPLQYILGTVPFCNITVTVKPPVLIPRPETEEWVCNLAEQLQQLPQKNIAILDIGAGSGCVSLSLAKSLPEATVYAVDIADYALNLSKKNAQDNHITNVTFLQSDLFSNLPPSLAFDLIVSNPPYIAADEWQTLAPSVTKWEDKQALVAGPDGLLIIREIIRQATDWLKPNDEIVEHNIPQLMIEIGYRQGEAVRTLLEQAELHHIRIQQDLEGKDRVACATL